MPATASLKTDPQQTAVNAAERRSVAEILEGMGRGSNKAAYTLREDGKIEISCVIDDKNDHRLSEIRLLGRALKNQHGFTLYNSNGAQEDGINHTKFGKHSVCTLIVDSDNPVLKNALIAKLETAKTSGIVDEIEPLGIRQANTNITMHDILKGLSDKGAKPSFTIQKDGKVVISCETNGPEDARTGAFKALARGLKEHHDYTLFNTKGEEKATVNAVKNGNTLHCSMIIDHTDAKRNAKLQSVLQEYAQKGIVGEVKIAATPEPLPIAEPEIIASAEAPTDLTPKTPLSAPEVPVQLGESDFVLKEAVAPQAKTPQLPEEDVEHIFYGNGDAVAAAPESSVLDFSESSVVNVTGDAPPLHEDPDLSPKMEQLFYGTKEKIGAVTTAIGGNQKSYSLMALVQSAVSYVVGYFTRKAPETITAAPTSTEAETTRNEALDALVAQMDVDKSLLKARPAAPTTSEPVAPQLRVIDGGEADAPAAADQPDKPVYVGRRGTRARLVAASLSARESTEQVTEEPPYPQSTESILEEFRELNRAHTKATTRNWIAGAALAASAAVAIFFNLPKKSSDPEHKPSEPTPAIKAAAGNGEKHAANSPLRAFSEAAQAATRGR